MVLMETLLGMVLGVVKTEMAKGEEMANVLEMTLVMTREKVEEMVLEVEMEEGEVEGLEVLVELEG